MSAITPHRFSMEQLVKDFSRLPGRALARLLASLGALVVLLCAGTAQAQLVVDLNEGHRQPMPIAITNFAGAQGANIASVVRSDLESTGLFAVQDPAAFLERNPDVNVAPRFADWRVTNTVALVVGRTVVEGERMRVEFRLWDVYGETQMLGLEFNSTQDNWRRVAHKVADAIYQRLTGLSGMFDSRVVFVAESGPRTNRVKRLAVMDQDAAGPSYLTSGDEQVLNPRFNASGQQIVYTALSDRGMRLWVLDIESGRREAITGLGNMVFAPRFTPDGLGVIFSSDSNGNTDIYLRNLRTRETRRLTTSPAIDTSPDMSPDGRQVVFTSDRGGSPQIYKMNADGSGAVRLSFGSGSYSTPVWSPDGRYIAFTRQSGGRFQIGVMSPDGSGERILAESYLVEGPTWAPNGRVIMYQREAAPGAGPELWTVDVSGQNQRRLPYPAGASDPAWSPLQD